MYFFTYNRRWPIIVNGNHESYTLFHDGAPYHVPRRAALPTSSLSVLRASVSTLLISSRGADGVKRKPGHWFPLLKIADSQSRTRFFFPPPPVVCGWRIGRGRLPVLSNGDQQLFDKLNIGLVNGWSAGLCQADHMSVRQLST